MAPRTPTATDSGLLSGDGGWSVPPAGGPRKAASFGLARALALTGGEMARARTLAKQARSRLHAQDDNTAADRIKKIEAWLAERGDGTDGGPTTPTPP